MSNKQKLQNLAASANAKLHLAEIYLDDGAPRSAARCYREGAGLLDQWADLRDKMTGVPAPAPAAVQ